MSGEPTDRLHPVRKTAVLLLMVIGMFWQALAVAGQGGLSHAAEDLTHAVLHWSDTGHHHHDDGSYHEDDSAESTQHVALDGALSIPALWPTLDWPTFAAYRDAPPVTTSAALPPPFVDPFRRPPRPLP